MVVLMVMTPLHMDHQNHGRDAISLVISAHTLGMFGFSPLTGYLIDRFGRIPMLVVGALTLIAAALLAPIAADRISASPSPCSCWDSAGILAMCQARRCWRTPCKAQERARVQGVNDLLVFFAAGIGQPGSRIAVRVGRLRRREHGGVVAGAGADRLDRLVQPPAVQSGGGIARARLAKPAQTYPTSVLDNEFERA